MNILHLSKSILLFSIISSFNYAMEKPPAPIEQTIQDYYAIDHLVSLKQKRMPISIPCAWIIDQTNQDQPVDKNMTGALLQRFIKSIEQAFFPIIVSHYLLTNFLTRQNPAHPNHYAVKTVRLDHDNWQVYEIPNTQFYLLVPKKYAFAFLDGFNIGKMRNVSHLLSDTQALINHIAQTKSFPEFSARQMETIFNTKSKNRWNFMISGHGILYSKIVDLESKQINALLDFFDKYLIVGVVFLETCYLGGANLSLLDFKNQGVTINHNFILLAGSVTDSPTYLSPQFGILARNFFNTAATLIDKGQGLNRLINYAYVIAFEPASIHGTAQIPQVWLPRGLGFQTLNTDKEIFSLSNIQLKIHEAENKPIHLLNKRAVLIYPEVINQTLIVNALDYKHPFIESPRFDATPHLSKLHIRDEQDFAEMFDEKSEFFPALKSRFDPTASPDLSSWLPAFSEFFKQDESFLFPDFISMIRSNAKHRFARIELQDQMPQLGVLRFLSDAFLDIGERFSKKTFFIDELFGNNDINLLLESSRIVQKNITPYPLEKVAVQNSVNGKVTLKNIIIMTRGGISPDQNSFNLQFNIGNTRWELDSYQQEPWHFKDISSYYSSYKKTVSDTLQQKTIGQILKQKQVHMQERRQRDIQRKQMLEKILKKS